MDCSHPPPPVAKSFVKVNGFPTLFSRGLPKRRDEFSVTVADESRPSSLPFFGYPIPGPDLRRVDRDAAEAP